MRDQSGHHDDAGAAYERLEALVGRWRTEGSIRAAARDAATRIDATDTYEWLPGRRALLHRVHTLAGDEELERAEIIGYDPARRIHIAQYVGTDGPGTYEASLAYEYGALVLKMRSQTERFTGKFSDDGNTIEGSLGVARRRLALAAPNGRHADQATLTRPCC